MLPTHVVDFETEPIENRPHYPPKPVGVSIQHADEDKPSYLAWGHPSGNNTTFEAAKAVLAALWDQPIVFHNAKFDTEVARVHFGLPLNPDPLKVHDTLFLNYLYDANADKLGLKESAERILQIAPTEQSALRAHLASKGLKDYNIAKAPGELVAAYANGDVFRTKALFEHLYPLIESQGMLPAYQREQRLLPILIQNNAEGVRINLPALERDLEKYEAAYEEVSKRLFSHIKPCNLDSSVELSKAIILAGLAQMSDFLLTPTGKLSTSKESMDKAVKDPALRQLLGYRGNLKTLLTTFMRTWYEMAHDNESRLHPDFNQVKGTDYGTRTGRLSSSNPNFQNIPTEFSISTPAGLPDLPYMRRYILPDDGQVLVAADFNSQEFRVAAHFAEGRAAEIYRSDPAADFHTTVAEIIREQAGLVLPRKTVKITGFSLLYGAGINALAQQLGIDKGTAGVIRSQYFKALPGLRELMDDVSSRGRKGKPVRTWGGRLIHSEKPRVVNGQQWDFSYKLVNYLIQGSAADQTKEAINTLGYKTPNRRFLMTVHDENVYSVRQDSLKAEIKEIRAVMETQEGWDVPWRIKVEIGPNFWDTEETNEV